MDKGRRQPDTGRSRRQRLKRGWTALNFEPGVLQVEVPLAAVHDVGADRTLVAELDDGATLRLEQLADQALVGKGAVLIAVVLDLARPRGQAPAPVVVQPAHPLDGVVAGPVLP